MAKNGLHLITPTSVSGTGLSITANGSVTMSGAQYVTLNGVFSADYDNYMVVIRLAPLNYLSLWCRLSSGGTWEGGTNYHEQALFADSTSISATRATSAYNFAYFMTSSSSLTSGLVANFYGPYLSQPTAASWVQANPTNSARSDAGAATHSLSNSYDGLGIWSGSGTYSGRIAVYGMVK